MYSPKIPERLIPALYRSARSRGLPMTHLVAEVLEAYLANQDRRANELPPLGMETKESHPHPGVGQVANRRLTKGDLVHAPDSHSR